MFEEFMGLPAHALLVHAAVVFVPLLALAGVVYAVVPRLRDRVRWAAVGLAVVGPASALFAKLSGSDLAEVLIAKNYPPQILNQVTDHGEYGDLTFWCSLALGVVTGLFVFTTSGNPRVRNLPAWVSPVLAVLVVVFGVLSAVYVYLTGDSGARAVWTGVL